MQFDGGSFRDPSGRVLRHGHQIFRAVFEQGHGNYRAARDSRVLHAVIERGLVLPAHAVPLADLEPELAALAPNACEWLEHPCLPFVSYPYEWCFSALQSAAQLHLDLHVALLEDGFTLSDATAYNVQFIGTRPIFIDHLSIVPYEDGSAWQGQRQFGMQFLNPLYLWAKKSIAPHAWYRGSVEGIEPEELAKLLGWRDRMSFTVLAQIVGPAAYAKRRVSQGLNAAPRHNARLPKPHLIAMLKSLRNYIADLTFQQAKTVWDDYAENNTYNEARRKAKLEFVANAVTSAAPNQVLDIGCNSGDFSQLALSAGAKVVVGFDSDFGALERAFLRFQKEGAPVLPLWLDAANPSPAQGWASVERQSMEARAEADMVLALAVIHHLAIARNVPLDMVVNWLMALAPTGVIEFPSKSDAMVKQLLRHRVDIFADYTEEAFLTHVAARGRIVRQERLGDEGRLIVAYDRRG